MIDVIYSLSNVFFLVKISNFHGNLVCNSEIWIEFVYHMIRKYRNDVGHPTGADVFGDLVFANL
ncbi:MAG: hypothetical protein ACFE96_18050 [Candidatus Hermodarchaeota archaeon]